MSNNWRRRDHDGGKQFHRRRKKADQFYKHEEDDRDDARAGRKKRERDRQTPQHYRQGAWEDEAPGNAGDDEEMTDEQESAGRSEHPGED